MKFKQILNFIQHEKKKKKTMYIKFNVYILYNENNKIICRFTIESEVELEANSWEKWKRGQLYQNSPNCAAHHCRQIPTARTFMTFFFPSISPISFSFFFFFLSKPPFFFFNIIFFNRRTQDKCIIDPKVKCSNLPIHIMDEYILSNVQI